MKRVLFGIFLTTLFATQCFANVQTYSKKGKFGLIDGNTEITDAKYQKLIKLENHSWIAQSKFRYGILNNNGEYIVEPKYSHASRILGQYVKLKKGNKYCLYDNMGFEILPLEYLSIDLLYGGMFLTCKNYKYGIVDLNGQLILDNIFDDIYMPSKKSIVIVYDGKKLEIENQNKNIEPSFFFENISSMSMNKENVNLFQVSPIAGTGYYGLTVTNYLLKIFSSISPAYEETIDELVLSQGADTINILMRCSWIPKFPIVYAKKYFSNLISPNSGPLNDVKTSIKLKYTS